MSLFCLMMLPIATHADIKINEFSPDQSPQKVEIINTSTQSADISSWYVDDSGGSTFFIIPPNTLLFPNSCYVLSADLNLNKTSSDTIRLFDQTSSPTSSSAHLIDSYTYTTFAKNENMSWYRIPDGQNNWKIGIASFGNYNEATQSCIIVPTPSPSPTPTPFPSLIASPTSTDDTELKTDTDTPGQIIISEVYPYPKSEEHEWIELYNNSLQSISSFLYIDDCEGKGSSPQKYAISAKPDAYFSIELSHSIFNNDGDCVRILDLNQTLLDDLEYADSKQGYSYGKSEDESNYCWQIQSKNEKNNNCLVGETKTIMHTGQKSSTSLPIQTNTNTSINPPANEITSPATVLGENIYMTKPQDISPLKPDNYYDSYRYTFSYLALLYSSLTVCYIMVRIKNDQKNSSFSTS